VEAMVIGSVVLVVVKSVICSQACKIIFRVNNFLKKKYISEEDQSKLDFSEFQNLTDETCGMSKSNISCLCREAKA
jgi:hypothetical protein